MDIGVSASGEGVQFEFTAGFHISLEVFLSTLHVSIAEIERLSAAVSSSPTLLTRMGLKITSNGRPLEAENKDKVMTTRRRLRHKFLRAHKRVKKRS